MRQLIASLCLTALLAIPGISLAEAKNQNGTGQKNGPQKKKLSACKAEATEKELKGDARKSFMQICLGISKQESEAREACDKMASDKDLKGQKRKEFMRQCLEK